jgi:hypothetical protein
MENKYLAMYSQLCSLKEEKEGKNSQNARRLMGGLLLLLRAVTLKPTPDAVTFFLNEGERGGKRMWRLPLLFSLPFFPPFRDEIGASVSQRLGRERSYLRR